MKPDVRQPATILQDLHNAAEQAIDLDTKRNILRAHIASLVREAMGAGIPSARLADLLGVTPQRVSQIRWGRR